MWQCIPENLGHLLQSLKAPFLNPFFVLLLDKSSKNLSTGAIIGICVAGLFVILVVVGAAVYWKKCHHRTRLRAAYYNDISMHDPLCEDFGPEVA